MSEKENSEESQDGEGSEESDEQEDSQDNNKKEEEKEEKKEESKKSEKENNKEENKENNKEKKGYNPNDSVNMNEINNTNETNNLKESTKKKNTTISQKDINKTNNTNTLNNTNTKNLLVNPNEAEEELIPPRPELDEIESQNIKLLFPSEEGPGHPRTLFFLNDPEINSNKKSQLLNLTQIDINQKRYMITYKAYRNMPQSLSGVMKYNQIIKSKL